MLLPRDISVPIAVFFAVVWTVCFLVSHIVTSFNTNSIKQILFYVRLQSELVLACCISEGKVLKEVNTCSSFTWLKQIWLEMSQCRDCFQEHWLHSTFISLPNIMNFWQLLSYLYEFQHFSEMDICFVLYLIVCITFLRLPSGRSQTNRSVTSGKLIDRQFIFVIMLL